ncbi:16S rRNA processing protein RimM [Xenococcus sp. PCC 7305]|uniref:ribosome maturation factor RimM n=1 Tax=Xenococcus sp. PCC 7305 TaxID=102125 RepID=UPI0002ABF07B|nr:ribosome maturation factor RimM [Xenococcus sp. PCC 7305]ELS01828.1 16S rRNA processing protein RimM [Xenococcus sp. PCC 7305]
MTIQNQEKLEQEKWLEIGTIVAAQGLRGEVRVYPSSDFPERFLEAGTRWLQHPETGNIQEIELLGGRYLPGKNLYVVMLEGIEFRDQAEALKGHTLLVSDQDRLDLSEDEYHVADLMNLEVFNQKTGENIGIVVDIFYAGNDLLKVQLYKQVDDQKNIEQQDKDLSAISRKSKRKKFKKKKTQAPTILIPFVKEIVPIVDLEHNRLEIMPPEGLLRNEG